MRKPPIFQISSITSPDECQSIIENIEKLGGFYDNSKVYASKATHLIVGSMSTSEKILCFISAGKWVLTKEYITECIKEEKFVDETDFHVCHHFTESKLARVSRLWMEKIRANKIYPFTNWNVACFIEVTDKSEALKRIILAGSGRVTCFNSIPKFRRAVSFTLVICDRQFQESARTFATQYNLLWYPYEAIPDFIMQGRVSDKPILDLKYYNCLIVKMPTEISRPSDKILVPCCPSDYSDYLISYEIYNELFNFKRSHSINYFQIYVEDFFKNMWENKAFELSIDYIEDTGRNEMPSPATFECLIEFLMENSKDVKLWSKTVNASYAFKAIYEKVYSYVLNKILNNPPSNGQLISYYDKVFENLGVQYRIDDAKSKTGKGIVDVLYLMSIHDYYLIKTSTSENRYKCLLQVNKIEENSFKILINTLLKDKNTPTLTYHKLLQVIAFCSKHFKTQNICQNLQMNLNENKTISTFEDLFSLLN